MKKLLMSVMLSMSVLLLTSAWAQEGPDSFVIQVNPMILEQNAPADITITAMKNGSPFLYYTGDVFLSIDELSIREYALPNNWRYQFIPDDLGKKTLSKGLEIRKEGKFTIRATNYDDTIRGSLVVEVKNSLPKPGTKTITILTPQVNSTVQQGNIKMSARSLELPNSPAEIYLNDIKVNEVSSDAQGNIDASLVGLKLGNNTLEVVITAAGGEALGRSEKITFAYVPLGNNLFKSIRATPNAGLFLGDLVTFDITTDPIVSSATIIFDNGERLPADKVSDGKFSRSTIMINTGELVISVEVTALGEKQLSTGVLTLFVDRETLIHNVTFKLDPKTLKDLEMTRLTLGKPADFFEVKYGLEKENLDKILETDRMGVVFQGIDVTKHRYFQITPMRENEIGKFHGAASDIYDRVGSGTPPPPPPPGPDCGGSYPNQTKPPCPDGKVATQGGNGCWTACEDFTPVDMCTIKGIRVTTQKVGGKYYLVWDSAPNAAFYTVYMADTPDPTKKMKLLDTTDTRYEYPFDLSSEEDIYAYFWLEATCDNGEVVDLANAKKVQVWPAENILLLLCLSLFIYAGIRLYRYSE